MYLEILRHVGSPLDDVSNAYSNGSRCLVDSSGRDVCPLPSLSRRGTSSFKV